MALKFEVGDRVRVVQGWDSIDGTAGTIANVVPAANFPYNVTLDELPQDIADTGTTVEGWMMLEDELEWA